MNDRGGEKCHNEGTGWRQAGDRLRRQGPSEVNGEICRCAQPSCLHTSTTPLVPERPSRLCRDFSPYLSLPPPAGFDILIGASSSQQVGGRAEQCEDVDESF